ncbi:hypothetical protein ACHAWO_009365 [Cyclotella atomus]|uniref:Uncharacterized protein n=1 Tax=Cyclotella atomus TaxID=382360 RepID=A0ABD3PYT8_9STRA
MTKSLLEKLSPASLAKNLWGQRKMPLRWKILFTAQSCIFVSALFMRRVDVENAQKRKLEEVKENQEDAITSNGNASASDTRSVSNEGGR